MMTYSRILLKNENGATAVYAAVVLALLLMFAALAVDVNYLYGVRNELHNAADAGSLAGASMLFDNAGELTVDAAIAEATRIASANKTGNQSVVEITAETGHWSFTNKQFTANPTTTQIEWQERPFSELDLDTDFINAVRVYTARSDTPSFFAKILGFDQIFVSTDAVAYIGFTGTVHPLELDQPIALCKAAITDADGNLSCSAARMFSDIDDTAAWTNLSTDDCNSSGTNNPEASALICGDGNPNEVVLGKTMGMINGHLANSYEDFHDCWVVHTDKKRNWNMTLPVVECADDGMRIENCLPVVGAVNVNVIWVNLQLNSNPQNQEERYYEDVPREMTLYDDDGGIILSWACPVGYRSCWKSFVDTFGIQDYYNPNPISDEDYDDLYETDHIYLLPDCTDHDPTGVTGGENFGIFSKYPVLVK